MNAVTKDPKATLRAFEPRLAAVTGLQLTAALGALRRLALPDPRVTAG